MTDQQSPHSNDAGVALSSSLLRRDPLLSRSFATGLLSGSACCRKTRPGLSSTRHPRRSSVSPLHHAAYRLRRPTTPQVPPCAPQILAAGAIGYGLVVISSRTRASSSPPSAVPALIVGATPHSSPSSRSPPGPPARRPQQLAPRSRGRPASSPVERENPRAPPRHHRSFSPSRSDSHVHQYHPSVAAPPTASTRSASTALQIISKQLAALQTCTLTGGFFRRAQRARGPCSRSSRWSSPGTTRPVRAASPTGNDHVALRSRTFLDLARSSAPAAGARFAFSDPFCPVATAGTAIHPHGVVP